MLTSAEKAALDWLESVIGSPVDFAGERQHARTIREMLKPPAAPGSEDERFALEWLERASEAQGPSGKPLRILKAMLTRHR